MSKTPMSRKRGAPEGALLFLYTETPLHVGASAALDAIDLPIQRERMSRLPMVPGSGLKGALREAVSLATSAEDWRIIALFGPEAPEPGQEREKAEERPPGDEKRPRKPAASDFGGAISLTDARLLLFPVRTARGGWAWTCSAMVLQRLTRDLLALDVPRPAWADLSAPEGQAKVGRTSKVVGDDMLIIEDLSFKAVEDDAVDTLARWLADRLPAGPAYDPFRKRLPGQLAVLSDTDFTDLCEHATEVATRVRIDSDTRTVQRDVLWTEEALPAESLLWSSAWVDDARYVGAKKEVQAWMVERAGPESGVSATDLRDELKRLITDRGPRMRLGGDQGTGRGFVGLRWAGKEVL